MILEQLLEKFEDIKIENTFLYFITRVFKNDIKKNSKLMDKYQFNVYQIDIDSEIRNHLYDLTKNQLQHLISKKMEIQDYDVITDDTPQLLTYQMKDKKMSFADIVNSKLKANVPKIKNLEEVLLKEELWAYSIGFYSSDSNWLYSFRKILSGKVAIDVKDNPSRSKLQKTIRTIFNSKSKKLEMFPGETVSLDKQIDCLYYNNIFYIARKTQFEQIVGLEEEFRLQALEVISDLEKTNMIDGIEILSQQMEINPSIHKKLVRLSKIGSYHDLDEKDVNHMIKISNEYGNNLKIKNGKLFIEDEKDIELALKMLGDYYKRGEVSGKSYGTYAGKQLNTVT